MQNLVLLATVGFVAQMVDGGLGMGYGATSSTLLLLAGYSPVLASASVHLAEVGTTLVSGISHWRFGNVDWPILLRLAIPGAIGAFVGAYGLSSLPPVLAGVMMPAVLLILGVFITWRVKARRVSAPRLNGRLRGNFLGPVGFFGGLLDAIGGGGWGPIGIGALLASGRLDARKAIGTTNAGEFLIAVCASSGFLVSFGTQGFAIDIVIPLLVGGVIAAPLAAWMVRVLPTALLGILAGGLLVITSTRALLLAAGSDPVSTAVSVGVIAVVWLAVLIWPGERTRQCLFSGSVISMRRHERDG